MKRILIISGILIFSIIYQCRTKDTPGAPNGLICELLRNPSQALITDARPEFGWIVNDCKRGAKQSAFQILIASSEAMINKNQGDMWDSGKTISSRSINVEYQGKPLNPNSKYWWKVRTWDSLGQPSSYSHSQQFNTGRFDNTDRAWPAESKWRKLDNGDWVLENRQKSSYHEIAPVKLIHVAKGQYFVDFGKAAFATLRLSLTSETDGDSLLIYLGERNQGNSVHKKPGLSNIGYKKATIKLMKGKHTYTVNLPRHISHYPHSQTLAEHMMEVTPYRYAEILGIPSELKAKDIRQIALYYYFDDNASSFTCSNDKLNQVWELCKYTLKATPFLALYADGNRERMPYEADSYIQQLGHYVVDREYSVARYTNQFLIFNPSWPTEWHSHAILMAWADYMQTGNLESIRRFYNDLKAKTLIALARQDGLISTKTGLMTKIFLESIHYTDKHFRDIVDWPAGTPIGEKQASNQGPTPEGERDGYVFMPINTVVNAFYYRSLVLMSKIAKAIDKHEDTQFFQDRAEKVNNSINALLFDHERSVYVDGEGTDHASLHANMFPLAFGLVPEKHIPSVVRHIKSRGMACSVYGAQYLLEALYKVGESQYALDLMTSDSKRSWINMIRVGSTMTTEAWDEYYKPNLTWNHAWGSAPANIIPRKLFGVEPLEPAFKKIRIKPQPGNLHYARLKMPTIRGMIHCTWKVENNRFNFDVTIPANTSAEIWLPSVSKDAIKECGKKIEDKNDIMILGGKDGFVVCEIKAGLYHFSGPCKIKSSTSSPSGNSSAKSQSSRNQNPGITLE